MKYRVAAALVATLGLVGFTANGAFAFYNSATCYGTPGQKMVITNYSSGSGQEYHWATYDDAYHQVAVVTRNGSYVAYSQPRPREGYIYVSSATSSSTFVATWWSSDSVNRTTSCKIYL